MTMMIDPYRNAEAGDVALWVAAASDGVVNAILYSDNGLDWTRATTPSAALHCLAYSPSLGAYIAGGFQIMLRSESPKVSWSQVNSMSSPTLSEQFLAAAWSPALEMFMVGTVSGKIYTSPTGATGTWTEQTPAANTGVVTSIIWSELFQRFYVVDHNIVGHNVQYTEDGVTFTRCTGADSTGGTYRIRESTPGSGDDVLVLTSNGDADMFYSTDGDAWSTGEFVSSGGRCLVYGAGRFFRGAVFGNRVYSDNGVTGWTNGSGDVIGWECAAYSPSQGLFVSPPPGGGETDLVYSSDGITWTARNFGHLLTISDIIVTA